MVPCEWLRRAEGTEYRSIDPHFPIILPRLSLPPSPQVDVGVHKTLSSMPRQTVSRQQCINMRTLWWWRLGAVTLSMWPLGYGPRHGHGGELVLSSLSIPFTLSFSLKSGSGNDGWWHKEAMGRARRQRWVGARRQRCRFSRQQRG